MYHINGLVQGCSNPIANALGLLQSCTKPSKWINKKFYNDNNKSITTKASACFTLRWRHQITSHTIVYSTVYSDADQRKQQSSPPLAFVWGIHRRPGTSPHKWPVTLKMFPFHDVTMMTGALRTARVPYFQHIIAAPTRVFDVDSRKCQSDLVTWPSLAATKVNHPAFIGVAATDKFPSTYLLT